MKVIAITGKGTDKAENEDRIVIGCELLTEGTVQRDISSGVLAVADGVGGHKAGAVASHFVAERLTTAQQIDSDTLHKINEELLQLSAENDEYSNMATTLSGISFGSDKQVLFSVGNTRVYLLQSGKYLKQLTRDDTTLNDLLSTGQLTAREAETFSRKNEITACFGGGRKSLFQIKLAEMRPVDAPVIMTSDGIHDYLSVDQMEQIIEENGLSVDTCKALIAAARAGGSRDDVSILMADWIL